MKNFRERKCKKNEIPKYVKHAFDLSGIDLEVITVFGLRDWINLRSNFYPFACVRKLEIFVC